MIVIWFTIIFIIPVVISLMISKFSFKLLFFVPLIEFGVVSLFNAVMAIIQHGHRGVRFDILWLIVGTTIATISSFTLLVIKKQHSLIISIIILGCFLLFNFLDVKFNFYKIHIIPFYIVAGLLLLYIGIIVLSFQQNRI